MRLLNDDVKKFFLCRLSTLDSSALVLVVPLLLVADWSLFDVLLDKMEFIH